MKIGLGGMFDSKNPATQPILRRAIKSGLRLHSCYHYGDALDSISQAALAVGIEPRMTLKIYFDCDTEGLSQPVPNQFERIKNRLKGFAFDNLDLQLCC